MGNLLADLPDNLAEEVIEVLASSAVARVERIVSTGQTSPPGFWYDQDEHEWVIVLRGKASLLVRSDNDKSDDLVELAAGDYIHLPAHTRHRVESTAADEPTVWLAFFYRDEASQSDS